MVIPGTAKLVDDNAFADNKIKDVEIKEGLDIKLMPLSRQVSSSCGVAARIDCEKIEDILSLCKEKN